VSGYPDRERAVAIVGAACLFPGAASLAEFHAELAAGRGHIGPPGEDRVRQVGAAPGVAYLPMGYLDRVDLFDHELFGVPLREAELMDPQQRLFLRLAHQALEDAGHPPGRLAGSRTGVFAAAAPSGYDRLCPDADPLRLLGTIPAALPARVAYLLDLHGPAVVLDTACSSGLAAVAAAMAAVRAGEVDLAVAGAVSVRAGLEPAAGFQPLRGVDSPDGTCRPFDARANGAVGGEGGGVVVLRALPAALAAGDRVHGVLTGAAVNHNGHRAVSMGAPSQTAQADAIAAACRDACVPPDRIGYVECHGSATPLGDTVELAALSRVFGRAACAIGSVKGNIGHLDTAAGIAGLLKAMLSVRAGVLYPAVGFDTLNPQAELPAPLYVNTELASWPAGTGPRRAGISSLGLTGTNVHVVLEQPPAVPGRATGGAAPGRLGSAGSADSRPGGVIDPAGGAAPGRAGSADGAGAGSGDGAVGGAGGRTGGAASVRAGSADGAGAGGGDGAGGGAGGRTGGAGSGVGGVSAGAAGVPADRVDAGAEAGAGAAGGAELLTLSAASADGLRRYRTRLADFLRRTEHPLRAVAHAMNRGRDDHPVRLAFTVDSSGAAAGALESAELPPGPARPGRPLVLLFSADGQLDGGLWEPLRAAFPALLADPDRAPADPADPAGRLVLRQYALYRLTTALGLTGARLVGCGAGNVAVRLARGELSGPAAVRAAAGLPVGPQLDLDRLAAAVDGFVGSGALLVELGAGGVLSREVGRLAPGLPVLPLLGGPGGRAGVLGQLGRLYTLGATIDWERYYAGARIPWIDAPTYPFAPTRCWCVPPSSRRPSAGPARSTVDPDRPSDQPMSTVDQVRPTDPPVSTMDPTPTESLMSALDSKPTDSSVSTVDPTPMERLASIVDSKPAGSPVSTTGPTPAEPLVSAVDQVRPTDPPVSTMDPTPTEPLMSAVDSKPTDPPVSTVGPTPAAPPVSTVDPKPMDPLVSIPDAAAPVRRLAELTDRVVAVWSAALKATGVGAESDYFALGGTSIAGITVLGELEREFGIRLGFADLYGYPTARRLAGRIGDLLPAGPAGAAGPAGPVAIPPLPRGGRLPLSYGQEQLWYLDQLNPGSSLYNVPADLRLTGPLDRPALVAALADLAARHEVLRSRIPSADGEPYVLIDQHGPDPDLIDLSALPAGQRDERAREAVRAAASEPFELATGPLWRAVLIRLAADEHVLALTWHHSIFDGWSPSVFFDDLAELYRARRSGRPADLPELPVQYADVAGWQRSAPPERLAGGLAHWRQRLAGLSGAELPLDRPRPPVQDFAGGLVEFSVDAATAGAVRSFSRRHGVTPFVTMLAALTALLHRWAAQQDVVIGVGTAGRGHPDTRRLVGYFNNVLPFRTAVTGDLSFADLVGRATRTVAGVLDHEDVPFDRIVSALSGRREPARHPVYDVAYTHQNAPAAAGGLPGLRTSRYLDSHIAGVAPGTAKFDLTLGVIDQDDGPMPGYVEYAVALFDRATAVRLAGWFTTLLAALLHDPDRPLAQIPLPGLPTTPAPAVAAPAVAAPAVPAPAVPALAISALAVPAPAVPGRVVPGPAVLVSAGPALPAAALWWQVVERVAVQRPDHPAVVTAGHCYSYRQLNRMANRLAWRLIDAGVRAELPVPVVAGRDIDLVVGWLAVAKAGGAFVPIDPGLPGPRIDTIRSDVDAPVAVVGRSWTGRRLAPTQLPAQSAGESADNVADANPPARSGPGNLAYACYTSGSNGRPHGCLIEHGQLTGVIRWYQDAMGMSADEQVLQGAGPSFDTTIMEVFATLCGGATLHLADEAVRDPVRLPGWLAERGITSAFLPTPIAEVLIGDGSWPAGLRLRRLSTGGDQLRLRPPVGTPFELLNMYGPTECTIVATAGPTGTTPLDQLPDIGGPISDTTVYLLDGAGRPVPPGELGEIYLGGAVVGRGYHRLPGLTATRFVADPFAGPGARMYQTGDLGRLCPNGTVEFHGRADNQLEIRGYRVEPAEVERVLAAHPAVGAALAVGVPASGGGTRLVAHVTATGPSPDERELIDFVAARLPDHMIPARVLTRQSLPRTVNGKLDRKRARQLPIPPPAPAAVPAAGPPPMPAHCPRPVPAAGLTGSAAPGESEVDGGGPERVLAGLCADLLGLGEVDPAANFFDLGGDSLLGIRLAARAARMGVHFGPRDLLLATSLRDLATPASVPAPSVPAPSVPAPSVPAPSVPAPSVPAPSVPAPSVPAPSVPAPPVPAPPEPATGAPTGRSSVQPAPPGQPVVDPTLAVPVPGLPALAVPAAGLPALVVPAAGEPAPGGGAGPVPAAGPSRPAPGAVRRHVPLTPIMYDFLAGSSLRGFVDVHVLEVPPAVDAGSVRAAVGRLVGLHEPLRYRFRHNELGWYIHPDQGPADIERIVDTRPLPPLVAAGEAAVVERDAAALAGQLDLRHGPVLRVRHYRRRAGQGGLLLLVVHHFVADSVASVVLLDDLDLLLADHAAGRPAPARPRRPAWQEWSEHLREMSRSDELAAEISYWTAILGAGTNRPRTGTTGGGELVQREIQLAPDGAGTGTEAALAVLAAGVARWQGTPDAWVMLEGAGTPNPYRPGGRPAEVGWFTSLHPALLPADPGRSTAADPPVAAGLPTAAGPPTAAGSHTAAGPPTAGLPTAAGLHPGLLPADAGSRPAAAGRDPALLPADPGQLIRASRDAVAAELRSVPNDGVGYGLLRHLAAPSPALAELRSLAEPEVFIAHQANDGSTADRGARLLRVRRDLYPPPRPAAGRFPLTLVSVARPGSLLVSVQAGPGFAAAEVNALADAVAAAADPATRRS